LATAKFAQTSNASRDCNILPCLLIPEKQLFFFPKAVLLVGMQNGAVAVALVATVTAGRIEALVEENL
jgi:hypothetical protein